MTHKIFGKLMEWKAELFSRQSAVVVALQRQIPAVPVVPWSDEKFIPLRSNRVLLQFSLTWVMVMGCT